MVVINPQQTAYSTDTLVCLPDTHSTLGSTTDTVVCHCYGVTESVIRDSIDVLGASTVADVTATTRAGAGCNGCHCRIRRMLAGKPATCGVLDICGECGFNTALCECPVA